jgi:hypothetical protein
MDFRKHNSQFAAYLDNDLSPGERATLQAHLKECLSCYRKWSSLNKTQQILKRLPILDPPEHLHTLVLARVKARHFSQHPWFFAKVPRWLPWAAGVAALLVISVTFWQLIPSPLPWQSFAPDSQRGILTRNGTSEEQSAKFTATKRSTDSSDPVMVLKVKDFSRADLELDSMLRSFAGPMLTEREAVRPVRSSSVRLIDVQVPGQRLPHLLRELHKIGYLDHSQVQRYKLAIPRHKKAVSVRIVVVTNGSDGETRRGGRSAREAVGSGE